MYMGGHIFCSMLYLYSMCGNFQGGWFNKKNFKKHRKKVFNSFALLASFANSSSPPPHFSKKQKQTKKPGKFEF